MIRAARGFDAVGPGGAALTFNGARSPALPNSTIAGRDNIGSGIYLFSSAFGYTNLTQTFDPQQIWGVHVDYAALVSGQAPTYSAQNFLQIGTQTPTTSPDPTAVYLAQRSDGKIDIHCPSGLIVTSSQSVPAVSQSSSPTYVCIELKVVFGPGGSVEMHFDGVLVAQANVSLPGPPYPSMVSIHQQGFGPPGFGIDNLVIWDGQAGDNFHNFTGRLRVTTHLPASDATSGWTPDTGSQCFSRVNETGNGAPDGDLSYITPTPTGPDQLFTVQAASCFGAIYALALSACAKPTSGAPTLNLMYSGRTGERVIGTARPIFAGQVNNLPAATKDYQTYQSLSAVNPDSGNLWTDADINNGEWGVGAAATPFLRVTQFYLEKITSLVPQPFDCGGASYSF